MLGTEGMLESQGDCGVNKRLMSVPFLAQALAYAEAWGPNGNDMAVQMYGLHRRTQT
jgi:hypothetical protein